MMEKTYICGGNRMKFKIRENSDKVSCLRFAYYHEIMSIKI